MATKHTSEKHKSHDKHAEEEHKKPKRRVIMRVESADDEPSAEPTPQITPPDNPVLTTTESTEPSVSPEPQTATPAESTPESQPAATEPSSEQSNEAFGFSAHDTTPATEKTEPETVSEAKEPTSTPADEKKNEPKPAADQTTPTQESSPATPETTPTPQAPSTPPTQTAAGTAAATSSDQQAKPDAAAQPLWRLESDAPAGTQPKKSIKRFLVPLVVLLLLVGVGAGAYYFFFAKKSPTAQPKPEQTTQVSPTAAPTAVTFNKADWTFEVLNGSGVRGAAAKVAAELEKDGYTVILTGNADAQTYAESQLLIAARMKNQQSQLLKNLKDTVDVSAVEGEINDDTTASARLIVGKDIAQ